MFVTKKAMRQMTMNEKKDKNAILKLYSTWEEWI